MFKVMQHLCLWSAFLKVRVNSLTKIEFSNMSLNVIECRGKVMLLVHPSNYDRSFTF